MSGGAFDYIQFRMRDVETLLEEAARDPMLTDQARARIVMAGAVVSAAATAVHRVDWFVSGDDGDESFVQRWDEDLGEKLHDIGALVEELYGQT